MDSTSKIFLERAENELELARIIFHITTEQRVQEEVFHVKTTQTFYSAVISHAYYAIFYSAKAYLLTKGIRTRPPEEHKEVFDAFKGLVEAGVVDVELLKLYEEVLVRADTLLCILKTERKKRGTFTYQQIAQANLVPAKESLDHARLFFKHIYQLCK